MFNGIFNQLTEYKGVNISSISTSYNIKRLLIHKYSDNNPTGRGHSVLLLKCFTLGYSYFYFSSGSEYFFHHYWLSLLSSPDPDSQLSVWMHRAACTSGNLHSKWCLTPPSLSHTSSLSSSHTVWGSCSCCSRHTVLSIS